MDLNEVVPLIIWSLGIVQGCWMYVGHFAESARLQVTVNHSSISV